MDRAHVDTQAQREYSAARSISKHSEKRAITRQDGDKVVAPDIPMARAQQVAAAVAFKPDL
jgi:hypothetical protein